MPAFDIVQMPERGQFDAAESYYNVLFHELAHSTGHESRLKRKSLIHPAPFGSEDYSHEELVAEFAAAFLTGEAGIEVPVTRSASYLANWLKVLKNDRKMLVSAAAQAQKAADLVLGVDWEEAASAATPEAVAA
jgi:antirestriction protein ArdC